MSDAQRAAATRRTRSIVLIAITALATLALGYHLADVLNPFLIALLIAYVLNPLVEYLERRRVRRIFTVVVVFGAVLVSVPTTLLVGAFSVASHLEDIRSELSGERLLDEKNPSEKDLIASLVHARDPLLRKTDDGRFYIDEDANGSRKLGLIERIAVTVAPKVRSIPSRWIEAAGRALETQAGEALTVGEQAFKGLQAFLGSLWNFIGFLFLVPIYCFFLLLSLSQIRNDVSEHLPGRYRERILSIARRLDVTLAAFFRGRLLIALAKALLLWLGLWMVGVRFAFFIGMVAGILSVVPFLGSIVGALLAIAFAYDATGWGTRCLGVGIVFAFAEALETILYPVLIGRNVGLHPLALILSIFSFGRLFGLFGVLLAVPIACAVKILFAEFVLPEIRALAAEPVEDPPP